MYKRWEAWGEWVYSRKTQKILEDVATYSVTIKPYYRKEKKTMSTGFPSFF